MFDPRVGRSVFGMAFFITFTSAILLIFLKPGTAEFVVDVLALIIGAVFMGVVALAVRMKM
ncbi:MAG: hypothetical protein ACUVXI_15290 [bacterium]